MHTPDALRLVARLQAIWPRGKWSPGTLDEWRAQFLNDSLDIAERALERLRIAEKNEPTLALWRDTYRAIARGIEERRHTETWAGPTDTGRAIIADIKIQLANRGHTASPPWRKAS